MSGTARVRSERVRWKLKRRSDGMWWDGMEWHPDRDHGMPRYTCIEAFNCRDTYWGKDEVAVFRLTRGGKRGRQAGTYPKCFCGLPCNERDGGAAMADLLRGMWAAPCEHKYVNFGRGRARACADCGEDLSPDAAPAPAFCKASAKAAADAAFLLAIQGETPAERLHSWDRLNADIDSGAFPGKGWKP